MKRIIAKCIPGQEERYKEFADKLKSGDYTTLNNSMCIGEDTRAYIRDERKYIPKIHPDYCEFYLWTRYLCEYWICEVIEDLACDYHLEVYKVCGEEECAEYGSGFAYALWQSDPDDEGEDIDYDSQCIFFDQHAINSNEWYRLRNSHGELCKGEQLLNYESADYKELTRILRNMAWKDYPNYPKIDLELTAIHSPLKAMQTISDILIRVVDAHHG